VVKICENVEILTDEELEETMKEILSGEAGIALRHTVEELRKYGIT